MEAVIDDGGLEIMDQKWLVHMLMPKFQTVYENENDDDISFVNFLCPSTKV